jgi:enoyl-CoA hydratase/carnithine racemase
LKSDIVVGGDKVDYRFIKTKKKGHLLRVTINRPEVMNALHSPAHEELDRAFDDFQYDPELWVAILTGAGEKAFSVGDDLKYRSEEGNDKVAMPKSGFGGITRRFDFFKPIIAAVNGFALGGGFEIALACDIVIAAENAIFGLPEPRVGMIAATGVHRLPRHVPYHLAMSLILTGKKFPAKEALRMGIVSDVVPRVKLADAAEKWADEILECAPLAVRACKEAVNVGLRRDLYEALNNTYALDEAMKRSEDYVEGPRAFAEKRKPNWKGR